MKTNFKISSCYKGLAIALIALTGFSSCNDDDDNEIKADAYVRIVNASEGSDPQDFYLDSTKVSSSAVAYAESSNYITTTSGDKLGRFKTSGTANVNSSADLDIEAGKYYTVYYTGGTSASASFTTMDNQVESSADKAKVRFVHLSLAAANKIDLALQGGAKIISDLAYKSASAYQEVNSGANFQLFASGSSNAALSLAGLNLEAGNIYTIYITGSNVLDIKYHLLVDKD